MRGMANGVELSLPPRLGPIHMPRHRYFFAYLPVPVKSKNFPTSAAHEIILKKHLRFLRKFFFEF